VMALGRLVLSKRERVIALEAYDKGLLGTTLRYLYEVRKPEDYFCDLPDCSIAPDMLRLAEHNSPLILPKTCAGPLHSMSPTIDMPEPMQERVPAFVGSSVAGGCSTTECCCCAVLPTTSAAFATAFFSLSGALLLNMSTSVFRRHPLRKGPRLSWAIELFRPQPEPLARAFCVCRK